MAVTHVTALRTAIANAVNTYLIGTGSGTPAGSLQLKASGVMKVEFNFPVGGFGAAVAGVLTMPSVPIAATATGNGTLDSAVVADKGHSTAINCSLTATGGGGDVTVSNTNIANGQSCTLDSLTYTAPV
jgi:hypothetical protein